jgi:tol-pal system protein YbgF
MRRRRHGTAIRRAFAATAVALGVGVAIGGCASSERAAQQREMAALRGQLEEVRKSQETQARELARLAGEMKALDAQSTFVLSEVKASSEERTRVKTSLEESGTAVRELQTKVDALNKAVAAMPAGPEQLYTTAMASLKVEAHAKAARGFRELTTRYPDDPLASNAQYWLGEAYYRERDFPEAVVEFRKVIDRYPASAQVPDALLKIGLCHRALKDEARARATWEQLTNEFPGTNAASEARSLLATPGAAGTPGQ